jgi:hypothetical protein
MPDIVHLDVILPKDRNHAGYLRVDINGFPKGEFRVLGRGSATILNPVTGRYEPTGNPSRNPFIHDGDTPQGEYQATEIDSTSGLPKDSYGPWGEVRLRATGGDALWAERLGRTGLLIHGGAAGSSFDGFRATRGCLRLHNPDMKRLIELLSTAGDHAEFQSCGEITVSVRVRQW